MKNIFMIMVVVIMSSIDGYAQMGVKVEVPLTDLHVNGNMQVSKDIRLGGTATTLGDPGKDGQILKSNGPDKAASWATLAIPEVPDTSSGSLIAVNGNMQIAEEITYLMDADFKFTETMTEPKTINTINTKIIDTYNNLNSGSFKVDETGIYLVTINAQLSYDTFGNDEESRGTTYDQTIKIRPVIGIWEDNFVDPETAKIGRWLARTNDTYTAMPNDKIGNTFNFQTYTLITAVKLVKDVKYSFRVVTGFLSKKHELTVKAFSKGETGSGPVSYYSVKRLN